MKLEQIRNVDCRACPLWESAVNVCVMGRGNAQSKVMLIGEAPGEAEQRTGMPFMGRSGKALQAIIDSIGLDPYITNICKCRPPNNRKPEEVERSTCGNLYLEKELRIIEPKLVVMLGTTAIEYFLKIPEFKRGTIYKSSRWPFSMMPTWHPSFGLRKLFGLNELRQHLTIAKEFMDANLPESD